MIVCLSTKSYVLTIIISFFMAIVASAQTVPPRSKICGKWESTNNSLIITISLVKNEYKAVIDWFSDTEGKPLDYWKDRHNPDPKLRNRKIHGLSILRNLTYHIDTKSWEDGMIYDSKHGKEWNASAYIDEQGLLRVKGYWHFKFIGRTMKFRRI